MTHFVEAKTWNLGVEREGGETFGQIIFIVILSTLHLKVYFLVFRKITIDYDNYHRR